MKTQATEKTETKTKCMTPEQKKSRDLRHKRAIHLAALINQGKATACDFKEAHELEKKGRYSAWAACIRLAFMNSHKAVI